MSIPPPLPVAPPDQPLGYHVSQEYRPTSGLQPRAALAALVLGTLAALAVAVASVVWHALSLPSIIGLAGLAQGLVLGALLSSIFRRTRLHSFPAAVVLTIVVALACNALTYAGVYVREVYRVRNAIRTTLADKANQAGVGAALMNFTQRPFTFYDNFVLLPETGHGGLVGFVLSKKVMTLGGHPTTILTFLIVDGLALLFATYKVGKGQVLQPFCDACGAWFGPPTNAAVVPTEFYTELVDAIQTGDPAAAIALNRQASGQDLGGACAVAQIHKCPGCGQMFADVVLKFTSATTPAMRPVRITPEMAQALKSEPAAPVADDAEPEAQTDPAQSPPAPGSDA